MFYKNAHRKMVSIGMFNLFFFLKITIKKRLIGKPCTKFLGTYFFRKNNFYQYLSKKMKNSNFYK